MDSVRNQCNKNIQKLMEEMHFLELVRVNGAKLKEVALSLSLGNFCLPIVRIKILLAGYPLYPKAVAGRGRVEWHVPSICHEEIIGYD